MAYTAYKIFNRTEFEATGLTSKTYTVNLDGIGEKDILVTKGELIGMLYEGVFLTLDLNGANPFEFDGFAIYEDENHDVHLGIEVA